MCCRLSRHRRLSLSRVAKGAFNRVGTTFFFLSQKACSHSSSHPELLVPLLKGARKRGVQGPKNRKIGRNCKREFHPFRGETPFEIFAKKAARPGPLKPDPAIGVLGNSGSENKDSKKREELSANWVTPFRICRGGSVFFRLATQNALVPVASRVKLDKVEHSAKDEQGEQGLASPHARLQTHRKAKALGARKWT